MQFDEILYLLGIIKLKPGMYIGSKSLAKLRSFIDGYIFAMNCKKIKYCADQYKIFNKWLAKRYNICTSELWDGYLTKIINDNELAFDLFFDELEIFMKENDIKILNID